MGAGVLPVAILNNKLYFLFGKERNRPNETARGWADFGGGHEKNESALNTAGREGAEELSGFLGSESKIKKLLRKKKLVIKTDDNNYTTFIVPINYDKNLPVYFNNQIGFLRTYVDSRKLNSTTMYEKEEIKWFSFNMLNKYKNKFRPFYREIISKIIKNKCLLEEKFKISKKKTKKICYNSVNKNLTKKNKLYIIKKN